MKPTIRDIAKEAGVSPAAVSYVLNGKPGVSDATREQILSIAKRMRYTPEKRSRSHEKGRGRFHRIAVVLRTDLKPIDRIFSIELTDSLVLAAQRAGFDLVFTQPASENGHIVLPEIIREKQVDGIIISGDIPLSTLFQLRETGLPAIEIDPSKRYEGQVFVAPDYTLAAYTAAKHLISLGHEDIAFIGNTMPEYCVNTLQGFQKATSEAGIALDIQRIFLNVENETELFTVCEKLAREKNMPTAFFCISDLFTAHLIQWFSGSGWRIPEDVSLTGIDDTIISRFMLPPLTTIHIDRNEIAEKGIRLLTALLDGKEPENTSVRSDHLIVRGSTAPPRKS